MPSTDAQSTPLYFGRWELTDAGRDALDAAQRSLDESIDRELAGEDPDADLLDPLDLEPEAPPPSAEYLALLADVAERVSDRAAWARRQAAAQRELAEITGASPAENAGHYAAGVYYANAEDAAIVRTRNAERAERDAARRAEYGARQAARPAGRVA